MTYNLPLQPHGLGSGSKDSKNKKNYLDPWFVTGFSDAEGCFMITIRAGL